MQRDLGHAPAIRARILREANGSYLRDSIDGAITGTVTTFAIVAGVVGANLPAVVALVLGLASLIANGFARAARNYSGATADRDNYDRVLAIERKRIFLNADGKREKIRQILTGSGFTGDEVDRIVTVITSDEALLAKIVTAKEYGLSSPTRSAPQAALSTFTGCTLCGLVPLITYLLADGLTVCIVATASCFFLIGAIKARCSSAKWWRSGIDTFFIGMSVAALALGVGHTLRLLINMPIQ